MTVNEAPFPARGTYADGFEPVARVFSESLARGEEIGAGFTVYQRGACVVDLHGGLADVESNRPWADDTRIVVFSVSKGLVAMAFHLLAERGLLHWDAPVASYWPGFAQAKKAHITVRTLLNHRAGLPALDRPLELADCTDPARWHVVREAMEAQRPLWEPGEGQGYHAVTYGMYAKELFARITGESLNSYLRRELLEPLDSDVYLSTPASEDGRMASLYPPRNRDRVRAMLGAMVTAPQSNEARVAREFLSVKSVARAAFGTPRIGKRGLAVYNEIPVRRAEMPWGSGTASARGIARAYLPFANGGSWNGRTYVSERVLAPVYARQGWSERDRVLQKPLGWSEGFLKEEAGVFGPTPEAFGHPGLGGALGWCDPVYGLTIGYAMNKLGWHVRSPRALALCRALYACAPIRDDKTRFGRSVVR